MNCHNRNHFVSACIIFWSVAVFRATDGGSITWLEPPPFETVTDPFSIAAANKSVIKGYLNAELSCNFSLTAGLSIVTVSMKFGGRAVASFLQNKQALSVDPTLSSRFNATWVPNKLTLILLNVTDDEEGEYRCEVISFGSSVQTWIRKIQVSLLVRPSISNITGQNVREGANVTLKCIRDGNPEPIITWTRLSDNQAVTMPLINISRHDAKDYRCTADNGVRPPATRDVTIDVQYPPELNDRVQNATVAGGVVYTFSCPVDGNPVPDITWYSETETYSGKNFRTQRSGCYICVAKNIHGISDNITQCLIINSSLPTVPPTTVGRSQTMVTSSTASPRQEIRAILTIIANYEQAFQDLKSAASKEFVEKFEQQMDKLYTNMLDYIRTEVTRLSPGSVIVYFILYFKTAVTPEKGIENLKLAISSNGTFGDFGAKDLVLISEESTESSTTTGPSSSSTAAPKAGPPWIIIIAVAGGVVLLAILVGVLTLWVHKKRKCRKDTKIHDCDLGRHDDEGGHSQVQGAYAQSGPPAANGPDGAAERETEVAGAIPSYAVVDKSRKSKKQADEKPPEYAVVDKSKKKEKQEAAAIPTYAAVDKFKKKKKSREEVPPVYAEVDKSKKKKKKIDDKNLYETLDEPKKEKKPGELLYADLGDFQNPGMPTVSISPQPLPAIKKADPYERTDYADITQFLKGNATLPPNDGNRDTEMKPKRPSKKEIQGNDKETPI